MIAIIIYIIISFVLDVFISLYQNFSLETVSIFKTIYSVISIVVIYNYFKDEKKYLIIVILLGILFDIVYTNTFILNILIFLIIGFIIKYLDYMMPNNILTINLKTIASIITYNLLTYLLLMLSNYNIYPISILIRSITHSIIMTIIYTSISYFILNKIKIKEIR